jgi:HK97 family phage major capsid protein
MVFPALVEAENRLKAKQDEMAKIFNEAGPDIDFNKVKSVTGDSRAIAAHVRGLNDDMTEISKEVQDLKSVEKAHEASRFAGSGMQEHGDGATAPAPGGSRKSFGELFTESAAYKGRTNGVGPEIKIDVELKTLFQTSAGFDPEEVRNGRIVESAQRPVQVMTADIIPQTTTSQSAVTYMEETTFTNTAAEVAEGGTYPEATLALTEQSSVVRKVAVFLPVTDEQLEDEPQARGYVNNRLPFMIRQRLDSQLLVGNGTAPNLRGILNVVGIQTQAKGADPTPDAVYKAMTKIRVTGQAMPDAAVFHPNDWQDIRLLRTTDGIYIWGNPSDAGPERIWGLRVVQAQALTENTGLVGDFQNFSELAVRRGIDVQVSNSHGTFFIEGKQALRADIRAALVVYRPAAFCTVTGI